MVVLSDDESFVVDPAITIAEQFSCTNDELSQIVSALNYPDIIVRSYPSVDFRSAIQTTNRFLMYHLTECQVH